ncbi:MAG: Ribosome biogenesis protein erb1 [Marteilia pararefringens]
MPSGYAFENISDNSLEISHPETIKTFNFHSKGNYISVVFKKPKNSPAVCIHNIKKQQTQVPFKKLKGIVINALFHPIKPIFFVISETLIKSFHLSNLENLVKIEIPSTKAVSSSLHKSGNHLIIGCDNGKVMWFDLELTIKPLRILNCHSEIVTDVKFHSTSDLFCSASEDGSTVVYDGKVFSDLMKNPEIMPIKKISAHSKTTNEPGVTCVTFTSKLNNIISGGHDKLIRLFA